MNKNTVNKIVGNLPEYDNLLKKEKERRAMIQAEAKKCDRNTIIFINSQSMSNYETIKTNNTENDYKLMKQQEESDFFQYANQILKESRDDKFKIRSRVQLEKLMSEPIYTYGTIKLKFRDDTILQGNFALQETIGDVYTFLFSHIKQEILDAKYKISIRTSFPVKNYTDMSKKIIDEKLYPNCLLYVNIEANIEKNFIREESLKLVK